jgi:hypothetical protein
MFLLPKAEKLESSFHEYVRNKGNPKTQPTTQCFAGQCFRSVILETEGKKTDYYNLQTYAEVTKSGPQSAEANFV